MGGRASSVADRVAAPRVGDEKAREEPVPRDDPGQERRELGQGAGLRRVEGLAERRGVGAVGDDDGRPPLGGLRRDRDPDDANGLPAPAVGEAERDRERLARRDSPGRGGGVEEASACRSSAELRKRTRTLRMPGSPRSLSATAAARATVERIAASLPRPPVATSS